MNLLTPYRYPLDPTGVDPNNLVVDELHILPNLKVRCVAPTYGGFYTDSVIVKDYVTGVQLTYDVDYKFGELLDIPSSRYGKEICGYLVIYNQNVSKITITYQVLGGNYSYSMDSIIDALNNIDLGNRPVEWGNIVGVPLEFPPESHPHPSSDLYGTEYICHSLERVRQAILTGDVASHDEIYRYIDKSNIEANGAAQQLRDLIAAHATNTNNPHSVTAEQLGLELVQNYGIATTAEAIQGTVDNRYMTPLKVMDSITNMLLPVSSHMADKNNPHRVTKEQLELGSVNNFDIATTAEAEAGASNVKYMTPLRVKEAITKIAGNSLAAHISDKGNPHQVTAAQLGLEKVKNYTTATKTEAEAGTSDGVYMTPIRVKDAITKIALEPLATHTARTDNPHSVTKAQVELGNVQNYGIATTAQAQAGTLDTVYMTPKKVSDAIAKLAGDNIASHVADKNNPHQVTAEQLNLEKIKNYPIATKTEAEAGSSDTVYMTPIRVKDAITKIALAALTTHINDKGNPHDVSKTDVGLSNVNNWDIATKLEAEGGSVSNKYMTPERVKDAIVKLVKTDFDTHAGNKNNPHQVTAAQLSLEKVKNYPIATKDDAEAGTSDVLYMTPIRVKESVLKFATSVSDFIVNVTTTKSFYTSEAFLFGDPKVTSGPSGPVFGPGVSTSTPKTGIIWGAPGDDRESTLSIMNYGKTSVVIDGYGFTVNNPIVAAWSGAVAMAKDGTLLAHLILQATGSNNPGMTFNRGGNIVKLVHGGSSIGFGGGSWDVWRWQVDQNGNTTSTGDVTAYSDPALKENFQEIEDADLLLDEVDGCIFNWKSGISENSGRAGKRDYGVLADQVEEKFPEFVHEVKTDTGFYKTVAYHKFVPVLIEAYKKTKGKLNQRIDDLERTLDEMREQLTALTRTH